MTQKGSPFSNRGYYCVAGAPSALVQWCDQHPEGVPHVWLGFLRFLRFLRALLDVTDIIRRACYLHYPLLFTLYSHLIRGALLQSACLLPLLPEGAVGLAPASTPGY